MKVESVKESKLKVSESKPVALKLTNKVYKVKYSNIQTKPIDWTEYPLEFQTFAKEISEDYSTGNT